MAKPQRSYQITVHTPQGRSSYIATARNGIAAVSDALGIFPWAKSVSAKPINTYRA